MRFAAKLRRRLAGRHGRLGRNFNLALQDSASWDERAEVAVDLLLRQLAGTRHSDDRPLLVADLGSGNERLRKTLDARLNLAHNYLGYDLQPQGGATKIDLEHDFPDEHFDVVFCLGLLEYLADLPTFLARLSRAAELAVVSYVISDGAGFLTPQDRRARGWLSDLTRQELESILVTAGFEPLRFERTNGARTGLWLLRAS